MSTAADAQPTASEHSYQAPPDPSSSARSLRRRKNKRSPDGSTLGFSELVDASKHAQKILVFSGSGLSASSGMSMFSTKNGLYERACKRFAINDGKKLFSWSFYEKQKADVSAFFVDIYKEAVQAKAGPGHQAVAELKRHGSLLRHYTMNVDGLASQTGQVVWQHESCSSGDVVELHGNVRYVVCPSCQYLSEIQATDLIVIRRRKPRSCPKCGEANLRFKIMLYDDGEADCITPENVWDQFEEDLKYADLVLWVGISFEQSASTEYFKKARRFLMEHDRLDTVKQAVINPTDEATFNLLSSCTNAEALDILSVQLPADIAMQAVAAAKSGDAAKLADMQKHVDALKEQLQPQVTASAEIYPRRSMTPPATSQKRRASQPGAALGSTELPSWASCQKRKRRAARQDFSAIQSVVIPCSQPAHPATQHPPFSDASHPVEPIGSPKSQEAVSDTSSAGLSLQNVAALPPAARSALMQNLQGMQLPGAAPSLLHSLSEQQHLQQRQALLQALSSPQPSSADVNDRTSGLAALLGQQEHSGAVNGLRGEFREAQGTSLASHAHAPTSNAMPREAILALRQQQQQQQASMWQQGHTQCAQLPWQAQSSAPQVHQQPRLQQQQHVLAVLHQLGVTDAQLQAFAEAAQVAVAEGRQLSQQELQLLQIHHFIHQPPSPLQVMQERLHQLQAQQQQQQNDARARTLSGYSQSAGGPAMPNELAMRHTSGAAASGLTGQALSMSPRLQIQERHPLSEASGAVTHADHAPSVAPGASRGLDDVAALVRLQQREAPANGHGMSEHTQQQLLHLQLMRLQQQQQQHAQQQQQQAQWLQQIQAEQQRNMFLQSRLVGHHAQGQAQQVQQPLDLHCASTGPMAHSPNTQASVIKHEGDSGPTGSMGGAQWPSGSGHVHSGGAMSHPPTLRYGGNVHNSFGSDHDTQEAYMAGLCQRA